MCKVCERKAIANGDAMEIYHRGTDPLTGDMRLDLEYALPRATRPVQPVHRVERVTAPERAEGPEFVTQKPCKTCTAEIRLRDFVMGGSDFDFTLGELDFKHATHCERCMTVWVEMCRRGTALASIDEMTAEHVMEQGRNRK